MIENEINHQESTKNHFKFSKICHNDLVRGSLVPLVLEDVYYVCWSCGGGGGLHDGLSDSLDSVVQPSLQYVGQLQQVHGVPGHGHQQLLSLQLLWLGLKPPGDVEMVGDHTEIIPHG